MARSPTSHPTSSACIFQPIKPSVPLHGPTRVEVGSDGLLRNLSFGGEGAVVSPEVIPWQAFWDGGQSNTGPDRKNGVQLRSNGDGVRVTVTAEEGGSVAFLDFEHPI